MRTYCFNPLNLHIKDVHYSGLSLTHKKKYSEKDKSLLTNGRNIFQLSAYTSPLEDQTTFHIQFRFVSQSSDGNNVLEIISFQFGSVR